MIECLIFKEMCVKFDVMFWILWYYEYIEFLQLECEGCSRFYGFKESVCMMLILWGCKFGIKFEEMCQWLLIYEKEGI